MSKVTGFGLICGHCHSPLRIRTSEGAHICLRVLLMQCTNEVCGATFRGNAEITHQYSPSGAPNPNFTLPAPSRAMHAEDRRAISALENKSQLDFLDESAPAEEAGGAQLS